METKQTDNQPQAETPADNKQIVPAETNPLATITKDGTYGGVFEIDPKSKALLEKGILIPEALQTGKRVGSVSFVAGKMGIPVTKETKLSDLRRKYDKATVNKWLKVWNQGKTLRTVHSRQIMALVSSDPNYRINARSAYTKKRGHVGFNISARFQNPETASKMSKDATIAFLADKMRQAGLEVPQGL